MIGTQAASFGRKKWVIAAATTGDGWTEVDVERFAHELRLPALLVRLLMQRGIRDAAAAQAFLHPRFRDLHPPELLPNMGRASERIAAAVRAGDKITLYGDYDVDGITGTTMLWHMLKLAGAHVETYIPHRVEEGYGLNTQAIDALIDGGTRLLVTVDCGCSAVDPIARARERGVDVVVSDHHEFGARLPEAYAIVHPRLHAFSDASDDPRLENLPVYPNPDLCGAGVAFKLAWGVAQKICGATQVSAAYRDLLVEFSALVALGTIADVVPLAGENRILVKYGLSQLGRTRFEGLRALIEAAGYGEGEDQKKIDCTAVGFTLAPRLNAAGRMGHAREAAELLTTATGARAGEIAQWLEKQNRDRQAMERKMLDIARKQLEERTGGVNAGGELDTVLVVAHESFHAGVVGIVASRLVDLFHRPAFVLAMNADECHGSARSIAGFELHLAIEHARDLLISGGGHAMAGGVRLTRGNLPAFLTRVNEFARAILSPDQLVPTLRVDGVLKLSDCHEHFAMMIEQLGPFGRGNPRPRFILEQVRIAAPPKRVGATGSHLQLTIRHPGGGSSRCIAFKMGDLEPELPVGAVVDLVVEVRLGTWQGRKQTEVHVIDISRSEWRLDASPAPAARQE